MVDVKLSDEDRTTLTGWTRKASGELRRAKRAGVVLALADGLSLAQAARRGGMHRHSAALWRDRFLEGGIEALGKDRPRPGKPKTIPAEKEEEIVRLTRLTTPEGATHWSTRTMARASGLSPATVQRIWAARGLKPHLIRAFKLSKDPDFEKKLVDVVGLYLDPPEKALVLCVDEKSQIQALERTRAPLPMKEKRPATLTHDYKRHGTTTLFAALGTLDGSVVGSCKPRHRHAEFLDFLREVEAHTPKELDLHLVLDNYATHKHADVKAWLEVNPRVRLHFVPTSCSWLNLVERFFARITNERVRRGSFESVEALERAIREYLDLHNQHPKPFKWTAATQSILDKIARCRKTCETLH